MCGVWWCVVWCVVWCACVVWLCAWHGLMRGKTPRAEVQHASVCTFKTPSCVPTTRPHVEHMRACCRYKRWRFECAHGSVLNLSTGWRGVFSPLLLFFSRPFFFLSYSLSFLRCLPLPSLFLSLLFPSRQQKLCRALINKHGVQL